LLAALLAACGSSSAGAGATPNSPSEAGPGSDGAGSDSATPTELDAPAPDSGQDGTAGDARFDSDAAIVCQTNEVRLNGSIGGANIGIDLAGKVIDQTMSPWTIFGFASNGGLFIMQGTDSNGFPLTGFNGSKPSAFYGLLQVPRGAAGDASVYCIGSGDATSVTQGARVTVDLGARLGACPGAPVAGSLDLCTSALGTCRSLTGTLDGASINLSGFPVNGEDTEFIAYDSTFAIRFTIYGANPVANGIVWTAGTGPNAGGIYCIGAGTSSYTDTDAGERLFSYTLTQFTKLGTCTSGGGTAATLSGCARGFF
jgi:hypothetical protein